MTLYRSLRLLPDFGIRSTNVAYYHIPTSLIDGVLTDFPVGIKVEDSTGFLDGIGDDDWIYLHARSGQIGEDTTECLVEVDLWDPTSGTAILWIRVPYVTQTKETRIKLYFGRKNRKIGLTGEYPATKVWDDDFVAVYHMSQDPTGGTGCIIDSTGNSNNGTPDGSMTSGDLVDDDIGWKALDFDGSNDYINCGSDTSIDDVSQTTIVSLIKLDSWGGDGGYGRIASKANANDNGWNLFVNTVQTTVLYTRDWGPDATWRGETGSLDTTDPHVISVTYDDSSDSNDPAIVIDSVDMTVTEVTSPSGGTLTSDASQSLWIGARNNGGSDREFDGTISEFRISKIVRSDAWIKAEQYNLRGLLLEYSSDGASPFGEKKVESTFAMSTDVDREYTRNTALQLWPLNEYFTTSNSGRTATHFQSGDWDTIYLTYPRLLSEGGKYYFEVSVDDIGGGTFCVGVQDGTEDIYTYLGDTSVGWSYMSSGRYYNSVLSYAPNTYVVGDIIGVAIDLDNGYIWWAKNNVWETSGDPENGTNPAYTNLGTVTQIYPGIGMSGLGADGTIAFFESDGTYDAPAGFYYWGEEPYRAGDIDDPEIGFSDVVSGSLSLSNRELQIGIGFLEVVGGGLYELFESHYFGNNNEGADSPTTTVGSPTLYDEWVTFDGNDGYGYTDHFVEDEVDVKVVFRIEEATDEIDGVRCIWKSGGGSNGIGFGISTDPDGVLSGYHIGAFAVDDGVRSGIVFPVENLLINTWYEAFITKEKITIRMQASPSVGFTRYGTLIPDDGTAPESVGYADTQSPLSGVSSSGEYFIGSVVSTEVFSEYTMDMPDDLSVPTYTPIEVFDFGSLYDGKAPTRFVSEIGTVTESTDHIEFDGTEGLYAGDDWGDETLLEFVVGFSVDSFSSAATFYKSGGSSNGVGVGIDASGNIGIFGMDDDSLSSITVSSTTLSTGTQYILYATQTEVRIYDAALTELLLRSTGSISIAAGTSYESLGFSQNGSPITAGTGNCDYLDGKLYFFELWLVGQLAFPVLNVEEKELDEDLGFADTIDGEIVTAIEYFSSVIGINDLIVGEKVSSQKEAESDIGFTVVAGADHIDESTGELDEEIGFNDEIGVHQQTYSIGFSSSVGFNDEPEAYNAVTRIGNTSNFGVNDSVDVLKQNNQTQENFGLDDTIGANITEIEGASEDIGFSDEIDGRLTLVNVGQSSFIGFDDSVYGGNPFSPDNEGNIGFNVEAEVSYYPVKGFSDIIGFSGETRNVKQYALGIEEGIGFNDSPIGENAGDLLEKIPANVTYKFYLTLTGANDSLDDYEITRLKTIQFRMKSGSESSYLGITAMYSQAAETEIDARSNGTLVLEMASVYEGLEVLRETLMEVSFSDVRYDLGSSSQSITINGYGTLSYDVDVVYLANAIAKKTTQNGRVNYRFARPNFYLRPGYKVVYGVENFTADEVSFYVGENKFYMDVYFEPSTLSGLNTNEIYRRYSLPTDRKRRFFAKLTGSQDATDDYIFSGIIDIQARLNFGKKSYASINVLHSQEAQDAIVARPNGDIVIEVIDGVGASLEEFVTVNFNEVSYNLLPSSKTITLVGYKTIQFTSGVIFEPTEVIAKGVDGGGFANITSNVPNLSVTPGFNIVYDGLDFIAGEVYFNFQQFSQQMSIKDTITITTENPSDTELGLTGSVVSNMFYRDNHSESILGIDNFSNVSINDVEEAHHDTCEIGFRGIINAELNPLF